MDQPDNHPGFFAGLWRRLAAARRFRIPIRFIGIGETGEDLAEFDARAFAEALVG